MDEVFWEEVCWLIDVVSDNIVKIKDIDYVFIIFVVCYLLVGLVGFLLVVIFFVVMFFIFLEFNVLVIIIVIDIYKWLFVIDKDDVYYFLVFKWLIIMWGVLVLIFVFYVDFFENFI